MKIRFFAAVAAVTACFCLWSSVAIGARIVPVPEEHAGRISPICPVSPSETLGSVPLPVSPSELRSDDSDGKSLLVRSVGEPGSESKSELKSESKSESKKASAAIGMVSIDDQSLLQIEQALANTLKRLSANKPVF